MSNLSNEYKMHIDGFYEQGSEAKAIKASHPDKNRSLNTLKTICYQVDEAGSAVSDASCSGRLICSKSSWMRQSYHAGADFNRMLLQLVDILSTLFNMLTGQLTFITETFKLFNLSSCAKSIRYS